MQTSTTDSTGSGVAIALGSHLAVGLTSLLAGVILGGWLAFETGHWRAFKGWIEGLGGAATLLVVGLLAVTVAVTALATYGRASRR